MESINQIRKQYEQILQQVGVSDEVKVQIANQLDQINNMIINDKREQVAGKLIQTSHFDYDFGDIQSDDVLRSINVIPNPHVSLVKLAKTKFRMSIFVDKLREMFNFSDDVELSLTQGPSLSCGFMTHQEFNDQELKVHDLGIIRHPVLAKLCNHPGDNSIIPYPYDVEFTINDLIDAMTYMAKNLYFSNVCVDMKELKGAIHYGGYSPTNTACIEQTYFDGKWVLNDFLMKTIHLLSVSAFKYPSQVKLEQSDGVFLIRQPSDEENKYFDVNYSGRRDEIKLSVLQGKDVNYFIVNRDNGGNEVFPIHCHHGCDAYPALYLNYVKGVPVITAVGGMVPLIDLRSDVDILSISPIRVSLNHPVIVNVKLNFLQEWHRLLTLLAKLKPQDFFRFNWHETFEHYQHWYVKSCFEKFSLSKRQGVPSNKELKSGIPDQNYKQVADYVRKTILSKLQTGGLYSQEAKNTFFKFDTSTVGTTSRALPATSGIFGGSTCNKCRLRYVRQIDFKFCKCDGSVHVNMYDNDIGRFTLANICDPLVLMNIKRNTLVLNPMTLQPYFNDNKIVMWDGTFKMEMLTDRILTYPIMYFGVPLVLLVNYSQNSLVVNNLTVNNDINEEVESNDQVIDLSNDNESGVEDEVEITDCVDHSSEQHVNAEVTVVRSSVEEKTIFNALLEDADNSEIQVREAITQSEKSDNSNVSINEKATSVNPAWADIEEEERPLFKIKSKFIATEDIGKVPIPKEVTSDDLLDEIEEAQISNTDYTLDQEILPKYIKVKDFEYDIKSKVPLLMLFNKEGLPYFVDSVNKNELHHEIVTNNKIDISKITNKATRICKGARSFILVRTNKKDLLSDFKLAINRCVMMGVDRICISRKVCPMDNIELTAFLNACYSQVYNLNSKLTLLIDRNMYIPEGELEEKA